MFTLTIIDSDKWIAGGIAHYFRERSVKVKVIDEEQFEKALTIAAGSDVVISEIRTCHRDVQTFVELFFNLRKLLPAPRLIILTDLEEEAVINYVTWRLPEATVISKRTPSTQLAGEIFGGLILHGSKHSVQYPVENHGALTAREFGLLRMLATKRTLTDIGQSLNLSVKTVSNHKRNIMRKLNCKKKNELPTLLAKMGFTNSQF
ncbi:LuxR C-terminal-related transcriptional regulator [Pantoea sp. DY-15]|uniref:helix-turn-helix transcriptional regulator n=1 Tax=Pantoea sp. DY-15 TaxID=2871489 RepID=UPI001C93B8FC|nr:LuxR C-terminal-related transcriptional regulator [Pantoea sp. DY-15]MBY4888832.1 LuxR C-terminal-related transcriptional regulator [Pantoea sp. DY-15]